MQQKVLATAVKIVQRRFAQGGELDAALQETILKTARKVVVQRAKQQQADEAEAAAAAEQQQPSRRLKFDGGEGSAEGDEGLSQLASMIESGLGEAMRRLERKVDALSYLMDTNALEEVEERLGAALGGMEARVQAVEAAPSAAVGERVAALEAALREQSAAVAELTAALHAQTQGKPLPPSAAAAGGSMGQAAAGEGDEARPGLRQRKPAAEGAGEAVKAAPKRAPPAPRLRSTHGAGAAMHIAMATAREQMAKQARIAREDEEKR